MAKGKEQRVKGVVFRSRLEAIGRLYGPAAVEETLDALPGGLAEGLRYHSIIASSWYPVAWARDFYATARRVCGGGSSFARDLAYEGANFEFKGIYRLMISHLSPQTMLLFAPRAFRTYWESGELRVVDRQDNYARAVYSGCYGFDYNIWESVLGVTVRGVEIAGAKEPRIQKLRGGGDGDHELEFEGWWSSW
ncbi:MAG: hypothetical protein R3B13_20365 [Polyangiaceae bacterium]